MKHILLLYLLSLISYLLSLAAPAAVPVRWTVETSQVQPVTIDALHGETLALEAVFKTYSRPLDLTGKTANLYWQTNGMESAYWTTNATVTATNRVTATFASAMDPGAPTVRGFLGFSNENYRAAFVIRFRPSPGHDPAILPLPTRTLDFATTAVANPDAAPFALKGGGGGVGGLNTNAVQALIVQNVETNYLATKADVEGRLPAVKNGDGDYVVEDAILSYLFVGAAGAGVQATWSEAGKKLTLVDGDGNEADLRTDDGDVITAGTLAAATYTKAQVNANFATVQTVTNWANYWQGDQVRITVTNYYGNTSGELPRLRIEEKTNSAWRVVWDEETRLTNSERRVTEAVNARTNELLLTVSQRITQGIASKAPRAWGEVTSAGEAAPPNTVWHTAPQTIFAGGMEYKKIEIGSGGIFVLTSKGQPVYTQGSEGQFRLIDDAGQNYFGFDIRSSYTLGCRTDSITVDEVAGDKIVTLTYDVTSSTNPQILTCTNLTDMTWTAANVSWEQSPPTGQKIAYINAGANPSGYYKAEFQYAAGSKFVTNMQADLAGGIGASNETLNVVQSVYPVIVGTNVVWRIKNVGNP